ncbi:mucin-7-like [Procambarus clarkii]|uniref:mucin-7-like n=1 Tax=Procambarus clarkii TaxID=6728 RepID=UPI00374402C1
MLSPNRNHSTICGLIRLPETIAGTNCKEFARILNILYTVNGLPTFNVPEELFTTTASATTSATTSATNTTSAPEIIISPTALADLLSADAHPLEPATDPVTSLHTASPDQPSTTPELPATTSASQEPTPDASADLHQSSDDSAASVDVDAHSPPPAS